MSEKLRASYADSEHELAQLKLLLQGSEGEVATLQAQAANSALLLAESNAELARLQNRLEDCTQQCLRLTAKLCSEQHERSSVSNELFTTKQELELAQGAVVMLKKELTECSAVSERMQRISMELLAKSQRTSGLSPRTSTDSVQSLSQWVIGLAVAVQGVLEEVTEDHSPQSPIECIFDLSQLKTELGARREELKALNEAKLTAQREYEDVVVELQDGAAVVELQDGATRQMLLDLVGVVAAELRARQDGGSCHGMPEVYLGAASYGWHQCTFGPEGFQGQVQAGDWIEDGVKYFALEDAHTPNTGSGATKPFSVGWAQLGEQLSSLVDLSRLESWCKEAYV